MGFSTAQGVYREQGATSLIVASGGTIRVNPGGAINAASGSVTLPGVLGQGFIDLGPHLFNARELASAEEITSGTTAPTYFFGGMLLPDTSPSLDVLSTADPLPRLQWVSANVDGILLPTVGMPDDLATAGGLTLQVFGESIGTGTASDAAAGFDIRVRSGVGDTEMGATHPNFTSTPSWQGITIASGDLTSGPLNIHLVPSAHAGRAINLYGMRAFYTKKSS